MSDTEISLAAVDRARLAVGQNNRQVEMPFRAEKDMSAEGGLFSTVHDMLRYVQYHLDEADAVVATAHQPLWGGQFGDFEAGLFWQLNKKGAEPDILFQNGGAYGTSSWMTLIPERNVGLFMVTNVAGPAIHQKLQATTDKVIALIAMDK